MKGHLSQEREILYSFLNVGYALVFPKADIKRQVWSEINASPKAFDDFFWLFSGVSAPSSLNILWQL